METKILGSYWFNGCVGIVRVKTEYEGIKYFCGVGYGFDEMKDAQYIADFGSTFPQKAGNALFGIDQ